MSSTFDGSEGQAQRTDVDWRRRRTRVFERDAYECQYCHRTGGDSGFASLQVHQVDTANSPTLVTLCRYCHDRAHRSSTPPIDQHLR